MVVRVEQHVRYKVSGENGIDIIVNVVERVRDKMTGKEDRG